MQGKKNRRVGRILAACAATALLALAGPSLRAYIVSPPAALPPGVRQTQRQLITVWIIDPLPGAAAWAQKRAGAYAAATPGISVWVRAVTAQDAAALADTPPDLAVFSARTPLDADAFGPACPLCLSGYALLAPDTSPVTPAPRSLFGLSPTPDPAVTPAPAAVDWPESFVADDRFGALALAALNAPAGGVFDTPENAQRRFQAGECALLSAAQAQRAQAQDAGYQVIAAAPATDLVMYGALSVQAGPAASGLLDALASEASQRALAGYSLLPARPMTLYGPDQPLLQALEQALRGGRLAPAYTWPQDEQSLVYTAQALYQAGESGRALLERLTPL